MKGLRDEALWARLEVRISIKAYEEYTYDEEHSRYGVERVSP